jgi:hypothetical protein
MRIQIPLGYKYILKRTCVWKQIKGETASNEISCVIQDSSLILSENLKKTKLIIQ